jgi:GT2 family glycosyltransferase
MTAAGIDKKNPLVYIIVLNWNGRDDTLRCLRSLRRVTYSPVKLLVVDNASQDGSVEAIRSEFKEVEIIENERNLLFADGNNRGIRYALERGAAYILLLNNDTYVDPQFLSEMVKVGERDESIAILGPKIYYADSPDTIWFAGGEVSFWRGYTGHKGIRRRDGNLFNIPGEVDYITGCALLIKRQVFQRIGGLDPAYRIYGEDADFCQRAKRSGFRLCYVPSAKIWHSVSSSSGGGMTPYKILNKMQSNFLFFRRYARWYHWFTIPIFVLLGFIRQSFLEVKGGNFRNIYYMVKGFFRTVAGAGIK